MNEYFLCIIEIGTSPYGFFPTGLFFIFFSLFSSFMVIRGLLILGFGASCVGFTAGSSPVGTSGVPCFASWGGHSFGCYFH